MSQNSRKDFFEKQLRSLQDDISTLSKKLSVSGVPLTPASTDDISYNAEREATEDLVYSAKTKLESRRQASEADLRRLKDQNASLQKDLQIAKYEKDMAVQKLHTISAEYDLMKLNVSDTARLKSSVEDLKRENEALKFSLESSERIRKQQKELISMLQRSQAIADAGSASVHSMRSGNDDASIASSTRSATPQSMAIGTGMTAKTSVLEAIAGPMLFPVGLNGNAAEHRAWLNTASPPMSDRYFSTTASLPSRGGVHPSNSRKLSASGRRPKSSNSVYSQSSRADKTGKSRGEGMSATRAYQRNLNKLAQPRNQVEKYDQRSISPPSRETLVPSYGLSKPPRYPVHYPDHHRHMTDAYRVVSVGPVSSKATKQQSHQNVVNYSPSRQRSVAPPPFK